MRILCTYCSASKDPDEGQIPAFKRYISPRIDRIQEIAEREGVHFCILSGKFGLVDWDQPLPYYDHLLRTDEVPHLIETVVRQLSEKNVTHVDYYTQETSIHPNVMPYMDVIEKASKKAGVYLQVNKSETTTNNRNWKYVVEVAGEARQMLIHSCAQGEQEFSKLLKSFPDDAMVFYQRARAYEAINQYGLAKEDYERAKRLFPLDRWRRLAQEGWDRCEQEFAKGGTIAESRRRLNTLVKLDPHLRQDMLSALNKVSNEPADVAKELRRILEVLVDSITEEHCMATSKVRGKLSERIMVLKNCVAVPRIVIEHMYAVNNVGNAAVHRKPPEPPLQASDVYPSVTALVAILEWLNSHKR